jgi:hypothetical protein
VRSLTIRPGAEQCGQQSGLAATCWQPRAPSCTAIPVAGESGNFLARCTATGQLAVPQAAAINPQIGVGLAMVLAIGRIDLKGPILANWMAGLVAHGATTAQRGTVILTPTPDAVVDVT